MKCGCCGHMKIPWARLRDGICIWCDFVRFWPVVEAKEARHV